MEMCPELSRAYLTFPEWPQPDLYQYLYQGKIHDIRQRLQQEKQNARLLQLRDDDQCIQFREIDIGGTGETWQGQTERQR